MEPRGNGEFLKVVEWAVIIIGHLACSHSASVSLLLITDLNADLEGEEDMEVTGSCNLRLALIS